MSKGWMSIDGNIVSVPVSSVHALKRMRRQDTTRRVWIDAVCINQDDVDEKSLQVAAVALIYRMGLRNVIYLGEDEEGQASGVLEALQQFHSWLREEWDQFSETDKEHLESKGVIPPRWKEKRIPPKEVIEGIEPLYGRPWFRRLWVVQEAALATQNRMIWGATKFYWPMVRLVPHFHIIADKVWGSTAYCKHEWTSMRGFLNVGRLHYHLRKLSLRTGNIPRIAFNLLRYVSTGTITTTDPRDRVFGVLALFQFRNRARTIPRLLTPDYRKSTNEVFRDATKYMLEEYTCGRIYANTGRTLLEFIDCAYERGITTPGLTSWTYKWDYDHNHVQGNPNSLFHTLEVQNCNNSYSQPLLCPSVVSRTLKIRSSKDEDVLTLKGYLAGAVRNQVLVRVQPTDGDPEEHDIALNMLSLFEAVRSAYLYCSTNEKDKVDDGYIVTAELLTAGHKDYWTYSSTTVTKADALRALSHHLSSTKTLLKEPMELADNVDNLTKSCSVLSHQFWQFQKGRVFFVTEGGLMGYGTNLLEDGDVVAVFEGESFPFILRPAGTEYRLVCAAYVYGLMDGEVFDMELPPVWIDIR